MTARLVARLAGGRDVHVLGSVAAGMVGQAAVIVSGPLVARQLGPEGRGELALLIAAVVVASEVCSLGGASALAYVIPLRDASSRRLVREHARWLLGTSALAGVLTGSVVAATGLVGPTLALLTGVSAAAFLLMRYALAVAQGSQWFGLLNIARPLPALVYGLAALALFLAPVEVSVTAFVLAQLVGSLACLVFVWRRSVLLPDRGHQAVRRRELVVFGSRALVGTSTPLDSLSLDQVTAGALVGTRALGLYAVGGSFANLTTFVLQSLGFVVGPRLALETDPETRRRTVRTWTVRAAVLAVMIVAAMQSVLRPGILILFGDEFAASVPIARVLVIAGMMLAMRKFLGTLLLGLGRSSSLTRAELAALTAFAAGVVLLHEDLGVMGVAWAMVAAGTTACVSMGWALRRALDTTKESR